MKERLDQLRFSCAPSAEFYDGLSENGREIYDTADQAIRNGATKVRSDYLR